MSVFEGRVEANLTGIGWTDISDDVLVDIGVRGQRGILSDEVTAFIEPTPTMTFTVNNSAACTGGANGYYTLDHPNVRTGWEHGIGVRFIFKVTDASLHGYVAGFYAGYCGVVGANDEETIWTGTLEDVVPEPGINGRRRASVSCVGYTNELALRKLKGIEVNRGQSEHDAVSTIYEAMPFQPPALEVDPGGDSYPYVFDLAREGEISPLAELQRISQSSLRYGYSLGDGTQKNEARISARAIEGNALTPDYELDENDLDNDNPPQVVSAKRQRLNLVRLSFNPRRTTEDDSPPEVTLFNLEKSFFVDPGETVTITGDYRDADELAVGAGGVDPVTPIAGTHYTAHPEPDGSGTPLTANMDLTATFGGTSVEFEIENTGAEGFWVTKLLAEGIGIYSQNEISVEAKDQTDIDANGEHPLEFRMPYVTDVAHAKAVADWILEKRGATSKFLKKATLLMSNRRPARSLELLRATPSQIISVEETMSGLDGTERWHPNGFGFEYKDHRLRPYWTPTPAYEGFEIPFGSNHMTTGAARDETSGLGAQTTGIMSPENENLVLGLVNLTNSSTSLPSAPTLSGNGLTWVLVTSLTYDNVGDGRSIVCLYRALKPTGVTEGKATITPVGATVHRMSWSFAQFPEVDQTGTNGSGAVVQFATQTGIGVTSITATLAAFGSTDNRPYLGLGHQVWATPAEEAGWTRLGRLTGTPAILTAWKDDGVDTSCTASIPGGSGRVGAIAVEIKMA